MAQVTVGRLDDLAVVEVGSNATVSDAFDERGMSAASDEQYEDLDGNALNPDTTISAGKTYVISENVKSGDDGDEGE